MRMIFQEQDLLFTEADGTKKGARFYILERTKKLPF